MKSLVIGKGQIGQALFEIFSKVHECYIRDVQMEQNDPGAVEVLHIAYPYGENFIDNTRQYIAYYKPRLTIIHSSVEVGTTDLCGDHVIHSPERGRFPNLAKEMVTFPKFIGAYHSSDISICLAYFSACGWPVVLCDNPRETELVKLLSNIHLGLEIAWRQEVDRIFKSLIGHPASEVYQEWEDSYNKGHIALGHRQLVRPTVRPAPIGGHCILPCTELLGGQFESGLFDFIKESNEKRKQEELVGVRSTVCADSHR